MIRKIVISFMSCVLLLSSCLIAGALESNGDLTIEVNTKESETESEWVAKSKTEIETEMVASLTDDDVILSTIINMGYEYIGGNSYNVLYQGGYAYTEIAGMSEEPPVGVASYAVTDLDGDGEDELLLVILEATDRIYDTSGIQDSRLVFTVCENENGVWVESQSVSQVSTYDGYMTNIMSIADVLPCISVYLVSSGSGKSIVIDNPFYGSFSADSFSEMFEIVYTEGEMFIKEYGGDAEILKDELEIETLLQQAMHEEDSILISKIYLPEFYPDGSHIDNDMYLRLTSGQDTSATLVLEDFRNISEREENDRYKPEVENSETEGPVMEYSDDGGLLIIY